MKIKSLLAAGLCTASLSAMAAAPAIGEKVVTSNGISYTVIGENLATNGDFSNGTADWLACDGNAMSDANFSVVPGAPGQLHYLKALGHGGSGDAKSVKRNIVLQPNKTYICSMLHRGSGSSMYQVFSVQPDQNATASKDANTVFAPTRSDSWRRSTFAFTTTETNYTLAFKAAWVESNFNIADFYVVEASADANGISDYVTSVDGGYYKYVTGENLIDNGNFTKDYEGWMIGNLSKPITNAGWDLIEGPNVVDKAVKSKGNGGSGGDYSIKKVIDLTPGKTYIFSIWDQFAVADNARASLSADVNVNDNAKIYVAKNSGGWAKHSYVIRPTEATPKFVINLAWLGDNKTACFGDFSMIEVEEMANPFAGKAFKIKQSATGLNWATANGALCLGTEGAEGHDFTFLFDATSASAARKSLNITSSDGRTLHRRTDSSKWEMLYTDANRDEIRTNFDVREIGGVYYIFNHDSNNILASDGINAGEWIYNDKGAGKVVDTYYTAPVELVEVPYAFSNRWIKEEAATAEEYYNSTVAGDQKGQYPADARAEFRAALDAAYDVSACTSIADIKAKIASIQPALDLYKSKELQESTSLTEISASAAAEYFDLNGRRVNAPLAKGVYILRQGNAVSKVIP